ncbi:hypothetical protein ACEQ8H_008039 [Pleosporales sp. CAS-2024a]
MVRYQLIRPTPLAIVARRVRRDATDTSSVPAPGASAKPEHKDEDGAKSPKSPDSPKKTSAVGADSDGDSDSEDERNAPKKTKALRPPEQTTSSSQTVLPPATTSVAQVSSSAVASEPPSVETSQVQATPSAAPSTSTTAVVSQTSKAQPASTAAFSSQGNLAAGPQITSSSAPLATTQPSSSSAASSSAASSSARATSASSAALVPPVIPSSVIAVKPSSRPLSSTLVPIPSSSIAQPVIPVQSEKATPAPQRTKPHEQKTMITKGGVAAAITLSVIGALAMLITGIIFLKRRKRRNYNQRLPDDPFNPSYIASLSAPETAHIASASPLYLGGGNRASHLTRSTSRSSPDSLFGAAPYARPETVSTDGSRSRSPITPPQATPNPFVDPPLNKAYDVLAGRPRSTTLTDRGSWIKNPFRNPESERFDPFGELQEKARMERRKYVEDARREAETQRQFGVKEKMGLGMPEQVRRKGSGATLKGVGVLDRSGSGTYR